MYLICHPEYIVANRKLTDLFHCDNRRNVKIYVVEEAHFILDWGINFRLDYKKISNSRSVFLCQVLLLSATVTVSGQKEIISNLLIKNCETVLHCITRH